ncbi:calcium:proton antiporter [Georgenia satyanarayanai]|uniref:calcium:proton antiporter n=1 Tax=Georgenia satyanarayanai TaxID=860221 RepID=UPI001264F268|nr:calcium:proton antiporter [Georgenia satyanarayanai]
MSTARPILTPAAVARLLLGWGAVLALVSSGSLLDPPVPSAVLVAALVVVVGVVLVCAFGVVHEAEHLARRLGDPYGSLVLTLSIVVIEVILISAVMLGPGEHATIARDSVMAVSMIILGAVVGLALLVGGRRHGALTPNRAGTSQYHSVLVVLVALALGVPAVLGTEGSYTPGQAVPVVLVTVVLYAFFLARQTGAQAGDFREVVPPAERREPTVVRTGVRVVVAEHRTEVLVRAGLLVATVLPVVLLSHDMAALLDDGLGRLGAPTALAGILIAVIVFLPESITAVRAALAGEVQRVSNLCHGALVSTVGLTIPAVLVIGVLTGQPVVLAESPVNLLLLGVTLLLSVSTFSAPRVTATHGAAHLAVFAVYAVAAMS